MVAPNYAAARSGPGQEHGLGKGGRQAVAPPRRPPRPGAVQGVRLKQTNQGEVALDFMLA